MAARQGVQYLGPSRQVEPTERASVKRRTGRNINAVALGGEAEVLFPPNTRFKVLRSEPATKQNYAYGGKIKHLIFLDEVPVKTGNSSKWW